MNITLESPESLQTAAYNPRRITDKQLHELAESILAYGFVEPVVINDTTGLIIGGHQRVKAVPLALRLAKQRLLDGVISEDIRQTLEVRQEDLQAIPVAHVNLTEPQEKALNLALNKISGEWDTAKLAEVLSSIAAASLPTGFSADEIAEILSEYEQAAETTPLTDPDAVPELDDNATTVKRGELWKLGTHRLYCGDSTHQGDIDKLLQGKKADMVFTDPPYLMNYQGAMSKGGVKKQRHAVITNDDLGKVDGDKFLRDVARAIRHNCHGAWYVSFYRLGIDRLYQALAAEKLQWRNLVIWAKEHFTLSNSDYKSQYEPIVVGWGDDYTPIFYGWNDHHGFRGSKGEKDIWEVELPSVWQIPRTKVNDLHPTIKPVALCERAILNSSRPGGTVLDLFGGSGSTLIAAEKNRRTAYMMELEPRYCDVIIKRWQEYTGQTAERL